MLNRIYIVIGSLLILLIAFAFIAPYLIDWSDRRVQIETLASEALGTEVHISGNIDIHVLPQPRVTMNGISVGPPDDPSARIEHAEAILSLTDFLRDRFNVTSLAISGADIRLDIDRTGRVQAPINLPETVNASNVSIANASLSDSAVTLTDARTGGMWRFGNIEGSLAMSALRGPFGFNATGTVEGEPYQVRINTSQMNADGEAQVALFVRSPDSGAALSAEGLFTTGAQPSFNGNLNFRQPPPAEAGSVRGNLVLEAAFSANTERARLTNYVLMPDENRAGTRMTGAAVVNFGEEPNFNAVVSGGVVALAPRDARTASAADPYEMLRLLGELPAPFVPPLPGTIGVDISELDLRAVALREVRLDARTDGKVWTVESFESRLPGDTAFRMSGQVGVKDGRPWGEGRLGIDTSRLDALVQLWRAPDENVPLFGIEASFQTAFTLEDGELDLSDGSGTFDGADFGFAAKLPSPGGELALDASLGSFDADQSRALVASLPEIDSDPAFAASFSGGAFDISADTLTLYGLGGSKLAARGTWTGHTITFSQLAAGEWGGASFTLSGGWTAAEHPVATASGRVILDAGAKDGALPVLYAAANVAPQLRDLFDRNLPASLDLVLGAPNDGGTQSLDISGRAGRVDVTLAANLGAGIDAGLRVPIGLRATLDADSPHDLADAVGFDLPLDTGGGATMTLIAEGTPANSMDTQLTFVSPTDKLQFTGSVIPNDLANLRGRGKFEFDLSEPAAWAGPLGLQGLYLPAVKGVSELAFTGADALTMSALNADAGGTSVRGDIVRALEAGTPLYTGSLALGGVDISGLPALFAGGASLLNLEEGIWPDGPFAEADGPRQTRGRLSVTANAVTYGDHALAGATSFDVIWDARNTRLRGLRSTVGNGTLTLDIGACCTGTSGPRQITARLGLNSVGIDALLPEAPAESLDARVTGTLQATGTGETIAEIITSLTGQGSFSAQDLEIEGFDPAAFKAIAASETLIEMDAEQLTALVADALGSGAFAANRMDGVLSLAAGRLRADNLAATADEGKLYGGATLDLATLGTSGNWTLTPNGTVGDGGLINETTGRIGAVLGGTLDAPDYALDLGQMVDTIQVRAYELEVERLEKLRAEDEARSRAAAEERARLMALEARQKAEEAAAKAEAEAKARAAAEAAARAKAEAEARAKAEAEAQAAQAAADAEAKAKAEREEADQAAAAEEAARKAAAEEAARQAAAESARKAAEEEAARKAAAEAQAAADAAAAEQARQQAEQQQSLTTDQQNQQTIENLLRELGESQDPQLSPNCPAPGTVAPADIPPGCPVPDSQPLDLLN